MPEPSPHDLTDLAVTVAGRSPRLLQEPLDGKPYDLFVARTGRLHWIGRKRPAPLGRRGESVKCCLITADMVEGLLDDAAVAADGVSVHVRPLATHEERAVVFAALTSSPRNDIRYPFRKLSVDGTEPVSPPSYWRPTPARVREWDAAEAPLRQHAVSVLRRLGTGGGRVFDPACSTGTFLAHLRAHLPGLWTIGQDRSQAMAEHAGPRIHEVHVGDCIRPAVPCGSVDVLVLRHLTVDVVDTRYAHALFDACLTTAAPGSLVLVMGHTPVLLPSAYFEQVGLSVLERIGVTAVARAAFQFYVLRVPVASEGLRSRR